MKFLKYLLFIGVGLVALFFIIGLFLPSEMKVERTQLIDAKPSKVYNTVIDFRSWNKWSEWHKMDPDMKHQYGGKGEGAWFSWESENPSVGKGKLTIIEAKEDKMLKTELDFNGKGTGYGKWKFEIKNGGTEVTWSMNSEVGSNIFSKYMGLAMKMMVGSSFEKGLTNLKNVVEEKA